jgi:hypothetical protein
MHLTCYSGIVVNSKLGRVSDYTKCELTYEKDKLIALSGIAERVERCPDSSYLAGLWKDDEDSLFYYMFWQSMPRYSGSVREDCKRPLTYRAPSWSWASVEGNIIWYHPEETMKWTAKIPEVDVVLADHWSTFGEVTSGSLVLSGCFLKARFSGIWPTWHGHYFARKGFEFPFGGDLMLIQNRHQSTASVLLSCATSIFKIYNYAKSTQKVHFK